MGEKYALDKMIKEWNIAKNNMKSTAKGKLVSQFRDRLDKLFDLCKYKCTFL